MSHLAFPMNAGPLAQAEIGVPNERLKEAQAWLTEYNSGELIEPADDDPDEADGV